MILWLGYTDLREEARQTSSVHYGKFYREPPTGNWKNLENGFVIRSQLSRLIQLHEMLQNLSLLFIEIK